MPGPGRRRTGSQIRSQCRAGANISTSNVAALRAILAQAGVDPSVANQIVRTGRTNREITADLATLYRTFRKPRA